MFVTKKKYNELLEKFEWEKKRRRDWVSVAEWLNKLVVAKKGYPEPKTPVKIELSGDTMIAECIDGRRFVKTIDGENWEEFASFEEMQKKLK